MPPRRRLALALLVLAVALAHHGLLAPAASWPGRHGRASEAPPPMQVRTLAPPAPRPPAPRPLALPVSPPPAAPSPRRQRARAARAPAAVALAAPAALEGPPPEPAPPPAEVRLRYRVVRADAQGEGELAFTRDAAGGYVLTLHAQVPGMAELDWQSTGRLTPEGLAPLRLVERRRGRAVRAVNFQRDKALISYSGPTRTDALRPGAQDRLSLLPHLAALVRARPGQDEWAVQVAVPGGSAEVWRFAVRAEAAGTVLVREPERPYDWRLELTLAPVAPQWPLRMVWTLLPGGTPIEWTAGPAS